MCKDKKSKDGYRYFVLLLSVLLLFFAIIIPIGIASFSASADSDLTHTLTFRQWNSVTKDASDSFSVDIYIDESKEVEFSISSNFAHKWIWSVNGVEIEEYEGKSSNLFYLFEEYGIYNLTVIGIRQSENKRTEYASWDVTVSLVIGEENDVRALPGLEDYTIRFSERPKRIVSLAPSVTEILFAAGAGDSLVGVTVFCNYPPDAKKISKIGGFSTPSLEKIVALNPDLIVTAHGNPSDVIYRLIELDFRVYGTHPKNIDEILAHIGVVSAIAGCEDLAESVVNSLRERLKEIDEKVSRIVIEGGQRPRVFFNIGNLWTAGSGTFIDAIIERAGGENIAVDRSGYFIMSMEKLVDKNPEIIICGSGMGGMRGAYEEIVTDKRLRGVDAVKNKRVYIIESDIIKRPGPRVVNAVERVHELFSDFFKATAVRQPPAPSPVNESKAGIADANVLDTKVRPPPAPAPSREEVVILFEGIALRSITLRADMDIYINLSNVTVLAERVETPGNISAPLPSDIVYTYLNIKVKNASGAQIDGKIEFRIAKSWLNDNNINVSTVTLWRYNESMDGGTVAGWSAFPTYKSKVSYDDENASVYFEAVTKLIDEYSLFAVTGEKEEETAETVQMPIDALEPELVPVPIDVDVDVARDVVVVFSLIGLLVGSVIALLLVRRNAFKR